MGEITKLPDRKSSILLFMAEKYGMEADKFLDTLKNTVMKPDKEGRGATNEEIASFLLVAKEYDLNPWTKEIYAFPDKKRVGIIPIVSIDGWIKLVNRHPDYDGMEIEEASDIIQMDGAKLCPAWMRITIHHKRRSHPVILSEYLDEVYQPPRGGYPGPWQTHTKRMLRHKTIIQGARGAFGFSGIYDEDEAQRIIEAEAESVSITMPKAISEKTKELPQPEKIQVITEEQRKRLFAIAGKAGKTHDEIKEYLSTHYNIQSTKDISVSIYDDLIAWAEQKPAHPDEGKITLKEVLTMIEQAKTVMALSQIEPFIDELSGSEKVSARMAYDKKMVELGKEDAKPF